MSFSNHNHKTKPQGCKFCSTKLTKEKFINKANKIHNFKYDYSLIEDKITSTEIIEPNSFFNCGALLFVFT